MYKLDVRYNKENLIARVQKIASYKNQINLYRQDALNFINTVVPTLSQKTLIYLDPPYYQKGAALYEHHYLHEDHVAMANALLNIKHKWVVSYDNAPEICNIYADYQNIAYDLAYSAADRYSGHEIIFYSRGLKVLDGNPLTAKNPRNIKAPKEQ